MVIDDPFANGQAQPGAVRFSESGKWLKEPLRDFGSNARTGVFQLGDDLIVPHIQVEDAKLLQLPGCLEDGTHTLSITYLGKEKVACSMGTFNCLKFNPTIIPGRIFKKNSKLYLWITDDNNRIPVRAHVEVVVGSLTMDLTAASGLKYPLNPVSKETD